LSTPGYHSFPAFDGSDAAIEVLETDYPTAVIARAAHGSGVRIEGGRALARYEHDEVARLLSA
jgi:hypothetical protein